MFQSSIINVANMNSDRTRAQCTSMNCGCGHTSGTRRGEKSKSQNFGLYVRARSCAHASCVILRSEKSLRVSLIDRLVSVCRRDDYRV